MAKFGFGSINDGRVIKGKADFAFKNALLQNTTLFFGRVTSVILDDTHPRYNELGGPKSIGTVEFVDYKETPRDTSTKNGGTYLRYAKPFLQNQKNIPVLNEIIALIPGPSYDIQTFTGESTLYYLNTLNVWGHPHHNSIPFLAGNLSSTQAQSILSSEITPNSILADIPVLDLGPGFIEKTSINPLKPRLGDTILEGRWGNTLRLSNISGSAITILRNGQGGLDTNNRFQLVEEDINKDDTSIYLLSNSKTSLLPASTNDYFSYKTDSKPQSINTYIGNQIVFNSNRIVLNSKSDHLLLTSNKSINLNAKTSINLETVGSTVLASESIYLGSQNATEPLLLGNVTVKLLENLTSVIEQLLKSATLSTTPAGPVEPLRTDAQRLLVELQTLKQEFNRMKSTRNFTI